MNSEVLVICFALATILLVGLQLHTRRKLARVLDRYSPITDLERAGEETKRQLASLRQEADRFSATDQEQRQRLAEQYEQARATYDALRAEVALLEENIEDISFGLYKPHFTFATSEEYKRRLEAVREEQRQIVRAGGAASSPLQWRVGESRREGERMVKQTAKLMLRAFNGECGAAVAMVTWNNIRTMEERVRQSYEAVNRLGSVLQITIAAGYLRLKLDELRLTHEYEDRRHQEKEEQRRIREELREEEKAQRELERAREDAEREESRSTRALEKARAEAAQATGQQLEVLKERIQALEAQLAEAQRQKERAISQAQLTKSGYVYVISNIGSFGEDILKVGMTRRLEPMDRVHELGGASVPFPFDVHALLYSENAPALEGALHALLEDRQVNMSNPRKEFYRSSLEELKELAREKDMDLELTMLAEARQFRETLARRTEGKLAESLEPTRFPASLFGEGEASAERPASQQDQGDLPSNARVDGPGR